MEAKMSTPTILSILLPTRGRREMLKRSIESLINTASTPGRLEILLGIDEDDEGLTEYLKDEIAPMLLEKQVECRANLFKPLGYENLHQYVNHLAGTATGEWLVFWNDDGIMLTDGWDDEIDKRTGQFKLLAFKDNHNGHPYSIFPILPKDWYNLMDHLSMNAQNDAWLSHIAYMLDIFERIDVEFIHDRADITGNNDDETFQNRKYMEGNPDDPRDFGHPDMQNARVRSAYKISWFLERIGQKSEFWERVKTGEQDPFEKMVWAEGVKGAGQLSSVNANKPKIDDEEKLVL
jgi:glycosyltransferase involved in cell wall biosynthesis